jgi:hypothetical protein
MVILSKTNKLWDTSNKKLTFKKKYIVQKLETRIFNILWIKK